MAALHPEGQLPQPVSVSVGAAVYPADGDGADDLIHKADLAMYQAKLRGGNGYCAWGTALWEQGGTAKPGRPIPLKPRRRAPASRQLTCLRGGMRT